MAFQGIDRAMVLAGQAFTALIPLLILVSALAPADHPDLVSAAIIERFHLRGDAADAVRKLFEHPGEVSTGVFSVVLLVFSGVSFTRRIQRMYLQAWRLPPSGGVQNAVYAALGLVAFVTELSVLYFARSLARRLPFHWVLGLPLSALAALLLWTSVPWLLLGRRMPWRRLLPAGALAALCSGGYGVATTVYMPHLFSSYSARYGLFGVTLALIGWLLCVALIVVAATVVAAEFDRAPESTARRLRRRLGIVAPADVAPASAQVGAGAGSVLPAQVGGSPLRDGVRADP